MGEVFDIREIREQREELKHMARTKCGNPRVEYLRQHQEAERKIQAKMERIARKQQKLFPGAQMIRDMPGGGGAGDGMDLLAGIMESVERLKREIAELEALEREIEAQIDAIPDADMREILEYRYLNHWSWQRIADRMHYDTSTVWRKHGAALAFVRPGERTA